VDSQVITLHFSAPNLAMVNRDFKQLSQFWTGHVHTVLHAIRTISLLCQNWKRLRFNSEANVLLTTLFVSCWKYRGSLVCKWGQRLSSSICIPCHWCDTFFIWFIPIKKYYHFTQAW